MVGTRLPRGCDARMTTINASAKYAINAPDVVSENFDGQLVILNLANGHYFSVAGIGSAIWSLLLAGNTPGSIMASIQAKRPEFMEQSAGFLSRLVELNLLRIDLAESGNSVGAIDEAWSGDGPEIQVYDELAELIFADPIHEVDEQAGWPTPRQTR